MPSVQPADPLQALRDVHAAPPVDSWPPALGWWLLLLLLLLLCLALSPWIRRRWRRRQLRRSALHELDQLYQNWCSDHDSQRFSAATSALLKRAALVDHDRQQVAGLSAERWAKFLVDSGSALPLTTLTDCAKLAYQAPNHSTSDTLMNAPKAPDLQAFYRDARRWLRRHL